MRDLKFRAWDKVTNRMCRVLNIDLFMEAIELGTLPLGQDGDRSLGDMELMQFTGIVDTSGRQIYEGDIVEYDITTDDGRLVKRYTSPVTFKDGAFSPHPEQWGGDGAYLLYKVSNFKIIGNVFENPELSQEKTRIGAWVDGEKISSKCVIEQNI